MSSSGGGGLFLTGHNDDVYTFIVNTPPKESEEYKRLKSMDFDIFRQLSEELQYLNDSEKQKIYLHAGLRWITEHPQKALELALENAVNFLSPGFDRAHHPRNVWLITLSLSLPIFALAYFEMSRRLVVNWREHIVIVSLFVAMLVFSVLFYSQNRFRVITIESWYLMYACSAMVFIYDEARKRIGVRSQEIVRLRNE